jgi:hypothetical protein
MRGARGCPGRRDVLGGLWICIQHEHEYREHCGECHDVFHRIGTRFDRRPIDELVGRGVDGRDDDGF